MVFVKKGVKIIKVIAEKKLYFKL